MEKEIVSKISYILVGILVYLTIFYIWFFALALIYEKWLRPALGW